LKNDGLVEAARERPLAWVVAIASPSLKNDGLVEASAQRIQTS
jgi:hypothetical protein